MTVVDWGAAAFLLPPAAWAVWAAASRLLRRRKRNRFRAAGMDAELAGRLAEGVPLRQVDAALAHWRDPDTVTRWVERGWFKLCGDNHHLWMRRLTEREKLDLAARHRRRRFRLPRHRGRRT